MSTSQSKWKDIFDQKIEVSKFFNTGTTYLDKLLENTKNMFWKDVLSALNDVSKFVDGECVEYQILTTPLWNNPDIKIGKKSVLYKKWFESGIYFINDLIDTNGKLYERDALNQRYLINCDYLTYNGIRSVVKKFIRHHLPNELTCKLQNPIIPYKIHIFYSSTKSSKYLYQLLLKIKCSLIKDSKPLKWNNIFTIDTTEWQELYRLPFRITTNTKLQ